VNIPRLFPLEGEHVPNIIRMFLATKELKFYFKFLISQQS